ncbi:MAG: EAL domain-containing protein [Rhodospirillaceae bacterium]|nr:EAL domain-containing protein [Rhodospirillaceae bacterium]
MNERARDGRKASDEEMLVDYAERLERHRAGRRAVQIHLSQLRPYNQRPHQLRIAKQVLDPLVKRFEAAIYQLWNNDLVVLAKGAREEDIETGVRDIKKLFATDPFFSAPPGSSRTPPFCDWYDIETDWEAFVDLARRHNEDRRKANLPTGSAARGGGEDGKGNLIGPAILEKLENAIVNADLANVLRRQQVFAIVPGAKPAPILTELFFSMPFLAQTVAPGYNVTGDKWLFQHLARVLDARMLALMPRQDYQPMLKNASLNLSLATVLSPEFLDFDRATNSKERGPLAIELPAMDYFSGPEDFYFARDFLKERGYKIILDQVKYQLLPLLDRSKLDIDLVKIVWSQALYDDCVGALADDMQQAVERIGRERVILCRVDAEQGLEIGQKLGLTLFQGRLLDAMVQAKS